MNVQQTFGWLCMALAAVLIFGQVIGHIIIAGKTAPPSGQVPIEQAQAVEKTLQFLEKMAEKAPLIAAALDVHHAERHGCQRYQEETSTPVAAAKRARPASNAIAEPRGAYSSLGGGNNAARISGWLKVVQQPKSPLAKGLRRDRD